MKSVHGAGLAPLVMLAVALVPRLSAQSPTGSAINVVVVSTAHADSGIAASVTVTDLRTGRQIERSTAASGRVLIENLTPGGPYTVEARAISFQPAVLRNVMLALGQRLGVTVTLTPEAVQLAEVTVVADANPLLSAGRTGPAHTVTDTMVQRLPVLNRDFVDLIQTAPEVSGTAVSSENNRYNNILIDGGTDNDYFGLSRGTGAPGGQIGVRSLPLDAVQEFQVQVAPFDVRQDNFTGGEVNAITRSGTNSFHGSASLFYQGQSLVGKDSSGASYPDFSNWQYSLSGGGPIIRDRLLFFVAGDLRYVTTPWTGPTIAPGSDVGISVATADSFTAILNGYALAPGSYGAYTTHNNSGNLFAKLSAPLGKAGLLEGSLTYADGQIQDTLAPPRTIGGDYRLTSAGFQPASTQWSGRARWTTVAGSRVSNELLATYIGVDEPRTATVDYPAVLVSNVGEPGFASARLIAGADPSSQELALTQRAFVLNDNATYDLGRHVVMAGLATEFMHFDFSSLSSAIGQYQFNNLTAFEAGTTARFIRSIPLRPGGETASFGVTRLGGYVQDRWQATPALTLTLGLRVTVPIFTTTPTVDSALLASPLAVNTGSFIGASAQWSPRAGFNWSFRPGSALRGGLGLFSGNIPYVWASFAYTQTGNDVVTLNCSGAAAPAFNPDPDTQPTSCVTAVTPAVPTVTYFAPGFRQPQSLKFSLGLDHQLPKGFVLSLDGLYDEGLDRMYISDANLTGPVATLAGEGGRVQYGTIAASSAAGALPAVTPAKVTTAFGPVLQNSNVNGDYAWLVTAQVRRTFARWLALNVAYTHSEAMDHMSLRDAQTVSNYGFVPVDGTLASRKLATSVFSTPNKVTISGTANLPVGFALSLTYIGRSGLPFTYIVNGDANADGVGNRSGAFDRQQNDAVYVPTDATDISVVRDSVTTAPATVLVPDPAGLAKLESFIAANSCLTDARGAILSRNSCRNPWVNQLNLRLAKRFAFARTQGINLTFDIFNFLNLLSSDWGLVRETGSFASAGTENVPMLKLRGQDAANGRNLYEVTLPPTNVINSNLSRWRMQLGARYSF